MPKFRSDSLLQTSADADCRQIEQSKRTKQDQPHVSRSFVLARIPALWRMICSHRNYRFTSGPNSYTLEAHANMDLIEQNDINENVTSRQITDNNAAHARSGACWPKHNAAYIRTARAETVPQATARKGENGSTIIRTSGACIPRRTESMFQVQPHKDIVVRCVSCLVHVCRYLQCACSVVPTCIQASFVLLLMPLVLYAWCYIVLLRAM